MSMYTIENVSMEYPSIKYNCKNSHVFLCVFINFHNKEKKKLFHVHAKQLLISHCLHMSERYNDNNLFTTHLNETGRLKQVAEAT